MKTWRTYVVSICILHLTLVIDALSGFNFLRGKAPIDLAGFKVVREALSLTYGILFSVFVGTVFLESRLLKAHSSVNEISASERRTALELWLLSPFSESALLRRIFWFLFIDGFLFLAQFSCVHLALVSPPDPTRMSAKFYMAIGAIDCLLLFVCAPLAYRTYENFQHVRSMLSRYGDGA